MPEVMFDEAAAAYDANRRRGGRDGSKVEPPGIFGYRKVVNDYANARATNEEQIDNLSTVLNFNNHMSDGSDMSVQTFYENVVETIAGADDFHLPQAAAVLDSNPSLLYRCSSSPLDFSNPVVASAVSDLMDAYNRNEYEPCHNWNDIAISDREVDDKALSVKADIIRRKGISDAEKLEMLNKQDDQLQGRKDAFLERRVGDTLNPNNQRQIGVVQGLMMKYGMGQDEATQLYKDADILMARINHDTLRMQPSFIEGYQRTLKRDKDNKLVLDASGRPIETDVPDKNRPIYAKDTPNFIKEGGFNPEGVKVISQFASAASAAKEKLSEMTDEECQSQFGQSKENQEHIIDGVMGGLRYGSQALCDDILMRDALAREVEQSKNFERAGVYISKEGRGINEKALRDIMAGNAELDASGNLDPSKLPASAPTTVKGFHDVLMKRYRDFPQPGQAPPTMVDALEMWADAQFPYLRRCREQNKKRDQEFAEKFPNAPRGIDTSHGLKEFFTSIFAEVARGLYRDGFVDDVIPNKEHGGVLGLSGKAALSGLLWKMNTGFFGQAQRQSAQNVIINGEFEKKGIDWSTVADDSAYGYTSGHDIDGHPSANQYAVMKKDIGRGRDADAAKDYDARLRAAQSDASNKGMGSGPDEDSDENEKEDPDFNY